MIGHQGGWCGRGVYPSHGGDFLEIWLLNTVFLCIIKFELTSTLAPKGLQMYTIQYKGWGKPFLLLNIMYWTPRGGGGGWGGGGLSYVLSLVEVHVYNM